MEIAGFKENNYFNLFEIPVTFFPDKDLVKKKFRELSRMYHPDRIQNEDGLSHTDILMRSAQINSGFKILNDFDALMAYVLKLSGVLKDDEKYALPQDFLMQMMDLNELISDMETGDAHAFEQAKTAMQDELNHWESAFAPLAQRFEKGEQDNQILLKIKDFYFRRKYLLRIKERIDKFAPR